MSAISSRGSKAPNTVVPDVAQTRNGTAPWAKGLHTELSLPFLKSPCGFINLRVILSHIKWFHEDAHSLFFEP